MATSRKKAASKTRSKKKTPAKKKPAATGRSRRSKGAGDPLATRSLQKVREILLGEEQRSNAERAADTKRRFDTLTARIDRLTAQLHEVDAKRQRETRALAASLTTLSKSLDERLAQVNRKVQKASTSIRALVNETAKGVRSSVTSKQREHLARVREVLEELRQTRVDRDDLATMFGELASRLNGKRTKKR